MVVIMRKKCLDLWYLCGIAMDKNVPTSENGVTFDKWCVYPYQGFSYFNAFDTFDTIPLSSLLFTLDKIVASHN